MLHRKTEKSHSRGKGSARDKILSPKMLNIGKGKPKLSRRQSGKGLKKGTKKTESHLQVPVVKNNLFNSVQELPVSKRSAQKNQKLRKKNVKILYSSKNIEDSTASRDFRQYVKQYNHPNGEYFGSKLSDVESKHTEPRIISHQKQKASKESRKVRSLQKKLRDYRRLSSDHRSESESLKSQLSEKQMRRLQKMQSLEKMMLMEQIMRMQSKRLNLKGNK